MLNFEQPDAKAGTPAYEGLAYRLMVPTWAYLNDVFVGVDAWLPRDAAGVLHPQPQAQTYLPKEGAEEPEDYLNRLTRSPWDDRFAQAIRKAANLILSNGVKTIDIPPAVLKDLDNLDGQQTAFIQLLRQLMVSVLRDGHTFVLVDYPPHDPAIRSEADFQASGRRPVWVPYQASQVIFWQTSVQRGAVRLELVTLREATIVSGSFSERAAIRYRILTPGRWRLCEERQERDASGGLRTTYVVVDEGVTSRSTIPLVCIYGGLKTGFFTSRPELRSLADLNVTHYQVKSDHLRKIHLCCLPVPELRDAMRPEGEDLKIGPNTFIHIRDPQGSFNWKEPLATSIEQTRREVQDLEAAMSLLSGSYLTSPSDRQAALTTQVQSAELESSLTAFAEGFAPGIGECLRIHAAYYSLMAGGSIELSGAIATPKPDPQTLASLNNFALTLVQLYEKGEMGAAIGRLLIEMLKTNLFLPDDFDYGQLPQPVSIDAGQIAIKSP